MRAVLRGFLTAAFLFVLAPPLLLIAFIVLRLADLAAALVPKRQAADDSGTLVDDPKSAPVSVVIPTWNGKHHLEANLPSVIAAIEGRSGSEILVVENASEDGSAEFLRERFPEVVCLAQDENLGFGGGSNAGFQAAKNDIVVLLNNDMRVEADFLKPLLEGFGEPGVFAVTAQIFFSDPAKRREETGLAVGRWEQGRLMLGHVIDEEVDELFPTFYAGGGSTAYDRRKFLEIGAFDGLLHPFYMEDVDVSYLAWKCGWKILYAPRSIVYHEHRGTIGRKFAADQIERIVHRNNLLFIWKNIHESGRLAGHFAWTWGALWIRWFAGPSPTRPSLRAWLGAFRRLPAACRARIGARRLAEVSDTEALRRPWPGYYRDRFHRLEPAKQESDLNVLFVSPYGIDPPVHGGAVFMNQTVGYLRKLCRLHLFCLVDEEKERASNERFGERCASTTTLVRRHARKQGVDPWLPYHAQDFVDGEIERLIHREIFRRRIDAVQIDYTQLAVYRFDFQRIATFLFEHDVYFQSVGRTLRKTSGSLRKRYFYEYLRALRFERRALRNYDAVQVCTPVNERYLKSFAWNAPPIEAGYRAGIDVASYPLRLDGREPDTVLFVGNFKHPPNQSALEWFVDQAWPAVRAARPSAKLLAVGAQAPEGFAERVSAPGVEFVGEVEDIREPMAHCAVFVAPILSGSGVRVKLLEAFAAGIPTVSTRVGAEGLAEESGGIVELADAPEAFARATVKLLSSPEEARGLAERARREVEEKWDMATITRRLAARYLEVARGKAAGSAG